MRTDREFGGIGEFKGVRHMNGESILHIFAA